MCGHKVEVKLFSFFFQLFFSEVRVAHNHNHDIRFWYSNVFEMFFCCWISQLLVHWIIIRQQPICNKEKLKKKPKKRSNFRKSTYRIIVSSNFPNPSLKSSAEKQSNSFVDIANTFCSSSSEPSSAK